MKMAWEEYTVNDLLDLFQNGMLKANPEYQRGVVWTATQQKKLIDSVMRRYPLSVIYLHHIKIEVVGMQREDLKIIDGQQRLMALNKFAEGALTLFHPVDDDSRAHFPRFLHTRACPWAKKDFESLSDDLKQAFLQTKIPVAKIETSDANEVRDLFVRLQAGLPLNPQEKRDAFPGDFTDFILRIGGKPDIARYPGHPFFPRVLKMKPDRDRGKTRTSAAPIAILFFMRRQQSGRFTHIHAQAIDEFYYTNVDFDSSSDDAKRFRDILDRLDSLWAMEDVLN